MRVGDTIRGSVQDITVRKVPSTHGLGEALVKIMKRLSVYDFGGDSLAPELAEKMKWRALSLAYMRHHLMTMVMDPNAWAELHADEAFWEKAFEDKELREKVRLFIIEMGFYTKGLPTHHLGMVSHTGEIITNLDVPPDDVSTDVLFALARVPKLELNPRTGICEVYRRRWANVLLIPLECIFRFGLPEGSSVFRKLKAAEGNSGATQRIYDEIGWTKDRPPEPWDMLPNPAVGYTTKIEATDRKLTMEEARHCSLLPNNRPRLFDQLHLANFAMAAMLRYTFAALNEKLGGEAVVECWDGKFEWILGPDGELVLGDTIDLDSIRVTARVGDVTVHLSKEMVRQPIAGTKIKDAIKACQTEGDKQNRDWKEIWAERGYPTHLPYPEEHIKLFDQMHGALAFALTGNERFANTPSLVEIARRWAEIKDVKADETGF